MAGRLRPCRRGSFSPRPARRAPRCCAAAGVDFTIEPAAIDEAAIKREARRGGESALGVARWRWPSREGARRVAAPPRCARDRRRPAARMRRRSGSTSRAIWREAREQLLGAARPARMCSRPRSASCSDGDAGVAGDERAGTDDARISATTFSTTILRPRARRCSARSAPIGSKAAACSSSRGSRGDYFAILGLPLLELLGFLRERGAVRASSVNGRCAMRITGRHGSPGSWAGRSPIRARRRCTISGSTNTASTAPMCRWRCGRSSWSRRCARLPALGFRGCNLTIPHKQAALAIVDRVEPLARRIGAVNTIIVAAGRQPRSAATPMPSGFAKICANARPDWDPAAGPGGRARRRRRGARGRRGADRVRVRRDPARQPHARPRRGAGAAILATPAAADHASIPGTRARRRCAARGCWSTRPASA